MIKIDWVKTMSIAGTVLGIAASVLSAQGQQKSMEKIIAEEVAKQLKNQQ